MSHEPVNSLAPTRADIRTAVYQLLHVILPPATDAASTQARAAFQVEMAERVVGFMAGEPAKAQADGYAKAFFEIADMLDIGARTESPCEVWETIMRPRLAALIARDGDAV